MKEIVKNMQKYFTGYSLETPKLNTLNIELTNVCDLNCVMCRKSKREKGFMSRELLSDILEDAGEAGVEQVALHTVGESILHPEIGNMIKTCKKLDFYVYIDVNGNSLDKGKAKQLIESGLDSIKFSVDAASPGTYSRIRRGGDFGKVYENMRYLRHLRDKNKSRMKIFTLFIISKDNIHELDAFKKAMAGVVDEIQYNVLNNAAGRMPVELFNEIKGVDLSVPNKTGLCANPWTRLVITWDGRVSMCCIDFDMDMCVGEYKRGNLLDIWNGKAAWKVREAMIEKKTDELPMICRGCDGILYDIPERNKIINEIFK